MRDREPEPGAARRPRAVSAPEVLEHASARLGVQALAGVLDRDATSSASPDRPTATAPSLGVCRSAFVSRFISTRSTFSGAKRAVRSWSTSAASVTWRSRASASTPRRLVDTTGATGAQELERQRAGVDARELEEVVDEPRQRPHLLA